MTAGLGGAPSPTRMSPSGLTPEQQARQTIDGNLRTAGFDPDTRTREVFALHQPETLAEWLKADTLHRWVQATGTHNTAND